METFWVIEKNGLYLGISCNQYRFHTLHTCTKFLDEVSARDFLSVAFAMFGGITSEFSNCEVTEHLFSEGVNNDA